MTMLTVRSSRKHDVRDHSVGRHGDHSLERPAVSLWDAAETQFLSRSDRIPLLRRPVAIDRVRAGFSGMYALPLAAMPARGCASFGDVRRGMAFEFATPCTTTQENVGDDGTVSSRGRENAVAGRSPRTVN